MWPLYNFTNWKHFQSSIRCIWRLDSHLGSNHRLLSSRTNEALILNHKRCSVQSQDYFHLPMMCHVRCSKGHGCNTLHRNYSSLTNVYATSKCLTVPSSKNILINTRTYSDNEKNSDTSSKSDASEERPKFTAEQIYENSQHPEFKEILKEMVQDFADELGDAEAVKEVLGDDEKNPKGSSLDRGADESESSSSASDSSSSDSDGSSSDSDTEIPKNLEKALHVQEWEVIDVDKEMSKYNIEEFYGVEYTEEIDEEDTRPTREELLPITLERGTTGVFDVEDLVTVLKEDNMMDICVIRVGEEVQFVDYMVLATGKALRQLKAAAENIQWIWKRKRGKRDPVSVQVEGLQSKNWLALDMGNIAVHLFLPEVRKEYDLETLWTCGPQHDVLQTDVTHQEIYSIPVSSGYSVEESRQALISKIDSQFRRKKHGPGPENENELGVVSKSSEMVEEETKTLVMSKEIFDKDTAEHRVKRKYMTDVIEGEQAMGFENHAGYHRKSNDSDYK